MSLFIPQSGQRVRVTEIAPFEHSPEHELGDEVVIGEHYRYASESLDYPGWLLLDSGTYCRVELVDPPAPKRSFFERLTDRIRAVVAAISGPPEFHGHRPPDDEPESTRINGKPN